MAHLVDFGGDAGSNLVSGLNTNTSVFTMPGNVGLKVESVVATVNNAAGAATNCTLTIRDSFGAVIATQRQGDTIPAAGSGTATFALRLSGGSATASAVAPVLDFVDFNPAAGFVQVTSVNPAAPTLIKSAAAVTFDGNTTAWIKFYASGMDVDQRGKANAASLLIELYLDGTAIGIVSDFGVDTGNYGITNCNIEAFDTPTAGTHTYSVQGYLQSAGAVGNSFVYGSNVTTPHATRPGYLAILAA